MRPLDTILFATDNVSVGAFRCAVSDSRFHDSGPIQNHLVAFPRTGVWIRPSRSRRIMADARVATIYNLGQEYRREPVAPEGDRSDWFAVAPEHARAIVREHDPAAADSNDAPFRFSVASSDEHLYLQQRRLFLRLLRGDVDRGEADEAVLLLVGAVVKRATLAHDVLPAPRGRSVAAHRELVDAARAELARTWAAPTNVTALAQRLDCSPYHLCRVFRRRTGLTLHAYRLDLRLRMAMERLAEPHADLSRLALELGFSSHSHFASVFRARYRMTPSDCRRALRGETRASACESSSHDQ